CNIVLPEKLFASRACIAALSGSLRALLFSIVFGHPAIGANPPTRKLADVEMVHQRARQVVRGTPLPDDQPLEANSVSGFAVTAYLVRTVPRPDANNPFRLMWTGRSFEEYGFPLRCVRTPIDIGLPRPSLRRLFFESGEDHFILTQMTHMRLL